MGVPHNFTDLTGKNFGKLTVISREENYVSKSGKKYSMWLCQCECGNTKRARDEQYYIDRDKRKNESVEIRSYVDDIEKDDCDCFDYDLVEY